MTTHVDTPQSLCRFALAWGDITPPVGIYHRMWGAARHEQATGVHRPLRATVAIFHAADREAGPQSKQIVIALDHCVMGSEEMNTLLDRVASGAGVAREILLVVFSHTHAAGLMGLERASLPGGDLIPGYLEEIARSVVALISQAEENSQAATITYGLGHCDLAGQRDFWDEASGQFVCGYNPDAPADDTVLVARVTAEDGRLLGTIVNYACHPTTLAWDNTLISPDYPGAMRDVIERATGAPCLFLQGASGDLGPKEGYVGDVSVADRNGRQLGHAALSALEGLPPPGAQYQYAGPVVSGATIGTWSHVLLTKEQKQALGSWSLRRWTAMLDYRPGQPTLEEVEQQLVQYQADEKAARAAGDEGRAEELRAMAERRTRLLHRLRKLPPGEKFPLQVVLWRIGGAVWLGIQGELYSVFQVALRKRFAGVPIVVAAVAYDWSASYLPPAELYDRGIYQESIAVVAPGSLERLTDEVAGQIEQILSPDE